MLTAHAGRDSGPTDLDKATRNMLCNGVADLMIGGSALRRATHPYSKQTGSANGSPPLAAGAQQAARSPRRAPRSAAARLCCLQLCPALPRAAAGVSPSA